MKNEYGKERARIKGYMWESVILRMLQENDFEEITTVDNVKTKKNRGYFLEMRGRGTWHQIDCPCDYKRFIPFVNPLRLLGEVKFHANPISKNYVREFIGTIRDIQENYFVSDDFSKASTRYTELGAFFSANGFQPEAEKLAFAHNIKTISHKNVEPLQGLKTCIKELERNYISAKKCISTGNQQDFIRLFRGILSGSAHAIEEFIHRFQPSDGFHRIAANLAASFNRIESNFVASSSGGALLHFVGTSTFPDELFQNTDEQQCKIFYNSTSTVRRFYLVFSRDHSERHYYFNPPVSLAKAAFFGGHKVLDEKERIFRTLHISRSIDGLLRTLVLTLDRDWLNAVRNDNDSTQQRI